MVFGWSTDLQGNDQCQMGSEHAQCHGENKEWSSTQDGVPLYRCLWNRWHCDKHWWRPVPYGQLSLIRQSVQEVRRLEARPLVWTRKGAAVQRVDGMGEAALVELWPWKAITLHNVFAYNCLFFFWGAHAFASPFLVDERCASGFV